MSDLTRVRAVKNAVNNHKKKVNKTKNKRMNLANKESDETRDHYFLDTASEHKNEALDHVNHEKGKECITNLQARENSDLGNDASIIDLDTFFPDFLFETLNIDDLIEKSSQNSQITGLEPSTFNSVDINGVLTDSSVDINGVLTNSSIDINGVLTNSSIDINGVLTDSSVDINGVLTDSSVDINGVLTNSSVDINGVLTDSSADINEVLTDSITIESEDSDNSVIRIDEVIDLDDDSVIDIKDIETTGKSIADDLKITSNFHTIINEIDSDVNEVSTVTSDISNNKYLHSNVTTLNAAKNINVNNEHLKEFDDILKSYLDKGIKNKQSCQKNEDEILNKLLQNNTDIAAKSIEEFEDRVIENFISNDVAAIKMSEFNFDENANSTENKNKNESNTENGVNYDSHDILLDTEWVNNISKDNDLSPHSLENTTVSHNHSASYSVASIATENQSFLTENSTVTRDIRKTDSKLNENKLTITSILRQVRKKRVFESKPISTIEIRDSDSECEGYHSSDFEFITESDAEKEGIITRQSPEHSRQKKSVAKRYNSSKDMKDAKNDSVKTIKYSRVSKNDSNYKPALKKNLSRSTTTNDSLISKDNFIAPANETLALNNDVSETKTQPMALRNSSATLNIDSPASTSTSKTATDYEQCRDFYRNLRAQYEMKETLKNRENHTIPEGQDYYNLFLMASRCSGSNANKQVISPPCMNIGEDLTFGRLASLRESEEQIDHQLKDEACETRQKILEMYPAENRRKRRPR